MSNVKVTNLLHGSSASNNITLASDGTTTIPTVKATTQVLVGGVSSTANGGTLQISNGITFPATQSACSDANTLDDYEEGTWTPTVAAASGSITTYTSFGTYTKIGRTVICHFQVTTTTIGTASGYLEVTNLPFSASFSSLSSFSGYGRDASTGFNLSVEHYSALKVLWQKYDGTFLGSNGKIFTLVVIYQV